MSESKRMVFWMAMFVLAVAAVCAALYAPLAAAFQANVVFNGLILGVLVVGAFINFGQALALEPATRWVDQTARGFATQKPPHLAAAGFGEFQPVDGGDSEAAWAKNRRIEIKLDSP